MVTLLNGLVGGLVATIVMTALMMMLGDDSPPPTAALYAKFVGGGDPGDNVMQGMVLHLLYGIGAGVAFVLVAPALGFGLATLTAAITWGIAWALVLFVTGTVFWMRIVLGMDAELKQVGMMLLFHVAYGLVLGAWVGYGVLG